MLFKAKCALRYKTRFLALVVLWAAAIPVTVGAQGSPTSSAPALAVAADLGKQVVVTPYGNLSFVELLAHPKKEEILSSIKPSVRNRFDEWELEATNKRLREKTAVLIGKYYQYVSNIERGASGERATLEDIRSHGDTPDDLKRRIDAMLRRTDLKIR